MSNLHKELLSIIDGKKITPYFQPIISLSQKKIIGYHALIRGPFNSPLGNVSNLFNTAKQFNLTHKLEWLCQEIILQSYTRLAIREKLFMTISASLLTQPDFEQAISLQLLEKFNIHAHSIVIELSNYQFNDDNELLLNSAWHCNNRGYEIALNNLGSTYSGLKLWSELLPDYVKLDKHFICDIDEDIIKFNFVRAIQDIARSLHCTLIATGINTESELKTIAKLGITHAQGNYIAKPTQLPIENLDTNLFISDSADSELIELFNSGQAVAQIAKLISPVCSETAISEVMARFQRNTELSILPLVDNNIAVGIIFRDLFLSRLFSSRYGLELYGKKPIKLFIDKIPLTVEDNCSIQAVSKKLTATMRNDTAFIISHHGNYAGIGLVMDLLKEITKQQIDSAKHANPLTLLPGSVPINEQMNRLIANKTPFSVAYFDLDNFKPFNDVYGYNAGDNIIKAVANTLMQLIPTNKGQVGHIGGDDFIVIFTCQDWLFCCKKVLKTFKNLVPSYYKERDVKAGGIHTENRSGQKCFYPLISLSIGIVDEIATIQCQSHVEISDLAAGAKKQAKKIDGNSLFINKRYKQTG
ncbi:MAG: GGDEF domain-containing protein [Methylococcaceae bacterium]